MSDRDERDQPEGVRILGAEEAQAVLEGDHGRADRGDREPDRDPGARRAADATWSEADFDELGELGGEETTRLGALADAPPPDTDEAFAAQVAARRRRGGSRTRPQLEPEPDESDLMPMVGRDLPMALLTAAAIVV